MRRYLRLYGHFLRFSFARSAQFRLDFVFRVLMDTLWYAHYLAFFGVLTFAAPTVGGWDAHQVRVFTGALFVVDALQMTFFANGLWTFPFLVNRGDLDYHLVRPVSTVFFVALRDISVSSFVNLLMAVATLAWALATYPRALDPAALAVFLALLPFGVVIQSGLHLLSMTPVFWTQSARGLRDVFWTAGEFGNRPVGVYRPWLRRVLTTVLPLAVMVSFPVRVLFEGPRPAIVLHVLAAAAGTWAVVGLVWRRGLRAYGSASS